MKIENVTEVNISIEEPMDEDKSSKDRCVESAMGRICEFQESRYAEKFGMVIEQQLRHAWNEGCKYAYGTCWKNAAEQVITNEVAAERAKIEGRKEVWDMVRRLYLNDVMENAYGYAELKKVFGTISFSELLQKDVHEMLAKDKEHLKRIEEEKIIRIGDKVEVDTDSPWLSGVCYGWVVDIRGETVHILISTEYGVEMRYVGLGCCRKTENTSEHLAQLVKAMKEEK